jgi:N-methylhydantoinase A
MVAKWSVPSAGPIKPRRRPARPYEVRSVWFDEAGGQTATPAYDWEQLVPGNRLEGPAVVDGADATLVVPPSYVADVDGSGSVVLSPAT